MNVREIKTSTQPSHGFISIKTVNANIRPSYSFLRSYDNDVSADGLLAWEPCAY